MVLVSLKFVQIELTYGCGEIAVAQKAQVTLALHKMQHNLCITLCIYY